MNKIFRFFGKKGRTTIPLPIRHALNMHTGDIISFSIKKGNVIIWKWICFMQVCSIIICFSRLDATNTKAVRLYVLRRFSPLMNIDKLWYYVFQLSVPKLMSLKIVPNLNNQIYNFSIIISTKSNERLFYYYLVV